jgi:hypothetical protein
MKILIILTFLFHLQNTILSIGYYERNIARKSYWLLGNNLYRLNGTHDDFWAIVDDEQATKKQILMKLGKWAAEKGAYMLVRVWIWINKRGLGGFDL